MAKCSICGKSVLFGNAVSHSHRRSNKIFKPNVKKVNVKTASGNKRIYVCTSCLRSGRVERAVKEPAQSVDSIVLEEAVLEQVLADTIAETAAAGAVAEAVIGAEIAEAAAEAVIADELGAAAEEIIEEKAEAKEPLTTE